MRVAANDLALKTRLAAGAGRGRGGLRQRRHLSREVHRAAAARRGADSRRPSRQRRPPLGARLLGAAAASEAGRGKPVAAPAPRRRARRCARRPCGWSRRPATPTPAPVEFLVDQSGNFYFIEVNARIQVEHPGDRDGHRHRPDQGADPRRRRASRCRSSKKTFARTGAAIECRINAEDPRENFQPSPGKIERLIAPGGFGVRFDSHAYSGYTVSPYYDSMIGKLIVHQPTRREAIDCMSRALAGTARRRHQDHHPAAPRNPLPRRLPRRPDRHDVRRADLDGVVAALGRGGLLPPFSVNSFPRLLCDVFPKRETAPDAFLLPEDWSNNQRCLSPAVIQLVLQSRLDAAHHHIPLTSGLGPYQPQVIPWDSTSFRRS